MVKLSILSFLRRLFNTSRSWDIFFYVLYFFYFGIFAAPFFTAIFTCKPISAVWDLRVFAATKGHCNSVFTESLAFSVIFAISDIILLIIPLMVVSKMNMRKRYKLGTLFIFALGGLSCVFCVWKAAYLSAVGGTLDDACKSTISIQLAV
jgi:rhodopsin domain-containing protein